MDHFKMNGGNISASKKHGIQISSEVKSAHISNVTITGSSGCGIIVGGDAPSTPVVPTSQEPSTTAKIISFATAAAAIKGLIS